MSVTLNEISLRFLLENPDGPVGQDLRRRAENVTQLVRDNATRIIDKLNPDDIDYDIVNDDLGLVAFVGVVSGGRSDRWARYLRSKELRERNIFAPALQQGLHP